MIDTITAEIDYRREQVQQDVAAGGGRTTSGRDGRVAADRPRPARPAVLRARPQAGVPVR